MITACVDPWLLTLYICSKPLRLEATPPSGEKRLVVWQASTLGFYCYFSLKFTNPTDRHISTSHKWFAAISVFFWAEDKPSYPSGNHKHKWRPKASNTCSFFSSLASKLTVNWLIYQSSRYLVRLHHFIVQQVFTMGCFGCLDLIGPIFKLGTSCFLEILVAGSTAIFSAVLFSTCAGLD